MTQRLQAAESGHPAKRLWQMDLLKAMAIFLVILGHVIQQLSDHDYKTNPGFLVIYSFHMPLFMVISGFFAGGVFSRPFGSMAGRRARQLILPALTWGTLIFAADLLLHYGGFTESHQSLSQHLKGDLWFLKSAFICTVLGWMAFRLPGRVWGILLTLAVSQIIMIFNVNMMYPCFLVGVFLARNINFVRDNRRRLAAICGVLFLAGCFYICFINVDQWMFESGAGFGSIFIKREFPASFVVEFLMYRYLRTLIGILAAVAIVALVINLDERQASPWLKSISEKVGGRTLAVYAIQALLLETVLRSVIQVDGQPLWLFDLVTAPLLATVLLAVCLLVHKVTCGGVAGWFLYGSATAPSCLTASKKGSRV